MNKPKKLTGNRYGRLVVIYRAANSLPNKSHHAGVVQWICLCDCGVFCTVAAASLKNLTTKSCGCLLREFTNSIRKHGCSHANGKGKPSAEYRTWQDMLTRCRSTDPARYALYGGRGITVCDRWLNSFENFLMDMGPRPGLGYSIDRKNNNLGYSPDNCHWATDIQQARNKRNNRIITINGESKTLPEWAEIHNKPQYLVRLRIRRGWEPERALSTPVLENHKRKAT